MIGLFLEVWYLLRYEKSAFKSEGENLASFPPCIVCVESGDPDTHFKLFVFARGVQRHPTWKNTCFVETKQVFLNMLCVNEPVVAESQWDEDSISFKITSKVQAPDSVIAYIYIYIYI